MEIKINKLGNVCYDLIQNPSSIRHSKKPHVYVYKYKTIYTGYINYIGVYFISYKDWNFTRET
jgi:hypothetical protein